MRIPWLSGGERPDGEESDWRRVPFIDLLHEKRERKVSVAALALGALLVVELLAALFLNDGIGNNRELQAAAQREADQLRALLSDEQYAIAEAQSALRDMDGRIAGLAAEGESARAAADAIAAGRTDWGGALSKPCWPLRARTSGSSPSPPGRIGRSTFRAPPPALPRWAASSRTSPPPGAPST
ncbi:MAG: hypothetical protein FJ319_07605 [SAR202 cluster bacterium]|nr:hypothetical protein [SAR202 cluster bacterium]